MSRQQESRTHKRIRKLIRSTCRQRELVRGLLTTSIKEFAHQISFKTAASKEKAWFATNLRVEFKVLTLHHHEFVDKFAMKPASSILLATALVLSSKIKTSQYMQVTITAKPNVLFYSLTATTQESLQSVLRLVLDGHLKICSLMP